MKNENGFGVVGVIITVIVLAALVVGGYYFLSKDSGVEDVLPGSDEEYDPFGLSGSGDREGSEDSGIGNGGTGLSTGGPSPAANMEYTVVYKTDGDPLGLGIIVKETSTTHFSKGEFLSKDVTTEPFVAESILYVKNINANEEKLGERVACEKDEDTGGKWFCYDVWESQSVLGQKFEDTGMSDAFPNLDDFQVSSEEKSSRRILGVDTECHLATVSNTALTAGFEGEERCVNSKGVLFGAYAEGRTILEAVEYDEGPVDKSVFDLPAPISPFLEHPLYKQLEELGGSPF